MNAGQRFDIRTQRRVFDDFFKIEEIVFVHERYDGNMSGEERRLVFERGDAVAVLLFDATARSVVLVEQFRLPALVGRRRQNPATTNGQIVELVAGMINEGETAEQAALREVVEETGTDSAALRRSAISFRPRAGPPSAFFFTSRQ
jgi:ADP-ribose diphosphatase